MPINGYACVSMLDQHLSIQLATLRACDYSVIHKASGSRRDSRSELQVLLDFVQPSNTLVVTRIDRLARSLPRRKRSLYLR
jgi:DNA invertase Pin-like site-specific DNA recombinase